MTLRSFAAWRFKLALTRLGRPGGKRGKPEGNIAGVPDFEVILIALVKPQIKELFITAADGFKLAATLYGATSQHGSLDHTVLVTSAAAVQRSFYDPYARFLAEQGFSVVTFDYRGIGDSRPQRLKGFEGFMHEWGEKDIPSIIDWVTFRINPARLLVVAHSIGGQLLGLAHNNYRISAVVMIASQSGYWGLYNRPEKYRQCLFSWVIVPALVRILGYLPVSSFRLGEDLPRGVALEWAKWSRNPEYLFGDNDLSSRENIAHLTAPILAYSIEDDKWATPQAVDSLMAFYSHAQKTRRHVRPEDLGIPGIGHFGFFKQTSRPVLWPETAEWLKLQLNICRPNEC
jgi:predicted alpha/beta hydrolase